LGRAEAVAADDLLAERSVGEAASRLTIELAGYGYAWLKPSA
jgi:hypothetical protein